MKVESAAGRGALNLRPVTATRSSEFRKRV
jgi:hypothetical protein